MIFHPQAPVDERRPQRACPRRRRPSFLGPGSRLRLRPASKSPILPPPRHLIMTRRRTVDHLSKSLCFAHRRIRARARRIACEVSSLVLSCPAMPCRHSIIHRQSVGDRDATT
ncbi:hypothetical protein MPTK1_2g16120 [Marchantia polymorpha subsp. ruderalis]|uniref:Uncharacterized protein n=1 Tax=Marchantia polymorpha TaxID=3197 RepID=A0A2R6W9V0_MARPO|nr:hypothetical protein MARPO_0122s0051 [Marchantia polymorpha]BBN02541.1 hypothetical protein Mp_2g16120 [Marchantia polymorpha subsp. ruderalis]|eukprot:PTQ30627.1 hypothetical protein MARPO_0122s0051 [Marchantia polymorpha]